VAMEGLSNVVSALHSLMPDLRLVPNAAALVAASA